MFQLQLLSLCNSFKFPKQILSNFFFQKCLFSTFCIVMLLYNYIVILLKYHNLKGEILMNLKINDSFVEVSTEEQLNIVAGARFKVTRKQMEEIYKAIRDSVIGYYVEEGLNSIKSGISKFVSGINIKSGDFIIGEVSAETNFGMGRYHCYNMCPTHNK